MQEVAGEGAAGGRPFPAGLWLLRLSDTVHLQGKSRAVCAHALQVSAGTRAETERFTSVLVGLRLCPVICKDCRLFEGGRQDLSL